MTKNQSKNVRGQEEVQCSGTWQWGCSSEMDVDCCGNFSLTVTQNINSTAQCTRLVGFVAK